DKDWERAIAAYASARAGRPDDDKLRAKLAGAYEGAGRLREAVPLLATASSADPKDTLLSLRVAAFQAWIGQEKELAATRQRILALAKRTSEGTPARRAAKALCILATTDKAELEATLALARTATDASNAFFSLYSLGLAEYRSGNYAAAEKALRAAAEGGA